MYMKYGKVRFGFKDTFSLDSTLSPIIHAALVKFKEVITDPERKDWVGVPSSVVNEVFPDKQFELTDEELEYADKIWLEILDKMIYAFNVKNEPCMKDYNFSFKGFEFCEQTEEEKENGQRRAKASKIDNTEEYERYKADVVSHRKAVEEGLALFGKHYSSLWW